MDPKEREIRNKVVQILRVQAFDRRMDPQQVSTIREMASIFDSDVPLDDLLLGDEPPFSEDKLREQAKAELVLELDQMFQGFLERVRNL